MSQSSKLMAVKQALASIMDLDGKTNIVAAGRVADLSVDENGKARFVFDAKQDEQKAIMPLLEKAESVVTAIKGIRAVQALATRHHAQNTQTTQSPNTQTIDAHQNPLGLRPTGTTAPQRKGSSKKERIEESRSALSGVDQVIAIASGKGGVGKSTLTVNLAVALKTQGLNVGILDCDIYGPSLPTLLNLQNKPSMKDGKILPLDVHGLKVMSIGLLVDQQKALAWRGPMVMGAVRQMINDVDWGTLDILLLDTPPGTGDAHLTLIQTGQLTGAVIVTTPQAMALADVERGISLFRQTNIPVIGLIENMAWFESPDGTPQYLFGKGGGKAMAKALDLSFLGALPLEPQIGKACDEGTPFMGINPEARSDSKAFEIITDIARKIRQSATISV